MTWHEHFIITKEQFETEVDRMVSAGEWRVTKLSSRMGYSEVTVNKFSKEYFGLTINHFINKKRMLLGRDLVMSGGHTIAEVAKKLGITRHHFSREYIKAFGVRPSLQYIENSTCRTKTSQS